MVEIRVIYEDRWQDLGEFKAYHYTTGEYLFSGKGLVDKPGYMVMEVRSSSEYGKVLPSENPAAEALLMIWAIGFFGVIGILLCLLFGRLTGCA